MRNLVKTSNNWRPNKEVIRGFFDADGSFQVKIYHSVEKGISFHVNAIFTQKTENKDLLKGIVDSLYKKGKFKKITNRVIINDSSFSAVSAGVKSFEGSSFAVSFSSPAGQELLAEWEKQPPNAPTKLLDYRIARLLSSGIKVGLLPYFKINVVNDDLEDHFDLCDDPVTTALTFLYIRFQMYAAKNTKAKRTPIKEHYEFVKANNEQIERSIVIGEKLMANIRKEQQSIISNPSLLIPNITEDYLLGYHIGDGCFYIQTHFDKGKGPSFSMTFTWTLTDCKENAPLLQAVKAKLESEGVFFVSYAAYSGYDRISVQRINDCLKIVNRWKGKVLPLARQNQYDCFAEALRIYHTKEYQHDLKKAERLIELKWKINPSTLSKKKGSFEEDCKKVHAWFNNKREDKAS